MSLRDEIEKRIASVLAGGPFMVAEEHARLSDQATDAALAALHPIEAVADAKPVIIYFPTEADREEFIEAIHAVKPGMVPVRVD